MDSVAQLVDQGLTITLIGMTVVFVLLTLLVGIIHAMSALARLVTGPPTPIEDAALVDEELIGVIAVAIGYYRRDRALETGTVDG